MLVGDKEMLPHSLFNSVLKVALKKHLLVRTPMCSSLRMDV